MSCPYLFSLPKLYGMARPMSANEGEPQAFAFDYFPGVVDPDFAIQPIPWLPPLSRSSSTGSHSSSRSRSSIGYSHVATGGVNGATQVPDMWQNVSDASFHPFPIGAEDAWCLPSLDNTTGLVKWLSLHPRSTLENRGRSRALPQMLSPIHAKEVGASSSSFH
jgi:hypothetical protein